jgi:hypothetical protein
MYNMYMYNISKGKSECDVTELYEVHTLYVAECVELTINNNKEMSFVHASGLQIVSRTVCSMLMI